RRFDAFGRLEARVVVGRVCADSDSFSISTFCIWQSDSSDDDNGGDEIRGEKDCWFRDTWLLSQGKRLGAAKRCGSLMEGMLALACDGLEPLSSTRHNKPWLVFSSILVLTFSLAPRSPK